MIMTPYAGGLFALVAYTTLWSAIFYTAILAVGTFFAHRFYEKHQMFEAFDDRLSDVRMDEARDYIIERRWRK